MPKTTRLIRFGVSMEENLLSAFDTMCAAKGYENRSEAIRDMARKLLIEDTLKEENAEGVGTLTLVYNHHQRELEEKLTEYQHHHLHEIITSLHIHLTAHLCLEVLLLRGKAREIKKVADGLIATKGVQHGQLVMTAVGNESH
ncbi:MAG: nickel-responsive transcriptional regulator NikR [Acidobacteriota bacterium]